MYGLSDLNLHPGLTQVNGQYGFAYFQLISSIHAPYTVQEYSCRYKLRSIIIQFHLIQLTLSIIVVYLVRYLLFS